MYTVNKSNKSFPLTWDESKIEKKRKKKNRLRTKIERLKLILRASGEDGFKKGF